MVFTPAGVTADDDLVFEVEALDPARPVVVVTDDRELRDRLAPYGVDLVSTAGFRRGGALTRDPWSVASVRGRARSVAGDGGCALPGWWGIAGGPV